MPRGYCLKVLAEYRRSFTRGTWGDGKVAFCFRGGLDRLLRLANHNYPKAQYVIFDLRHLPFRQ